MNPTDPDRELRRRFQSLAREEEAGAPAYRRPAAPSAPRHRKWRLAALAAAAVVVAIAGTLLLRDRGGSGPGPAASALGIDLAAAVWVAPTDFLLETPGVALLRGVPRFEIDTLIPTPSTSPRAAGEPAAGRNL